MGCLDQSREYLLWWESHRDRWVAVPVIREGGVIVESEYDDRVIVDVSA